MMKFFRWIQSSLILSLACITFPVLAQTGPVKIVYGFGAGGSGDALARIVAEHLRTALGRPVIVENRVGAGGRIAIEMVKTAAPDGDTLLLTPMGPMAILPHTTGNLRYDPFKDFEPVAQLVSSPLVLAVSSTLPVKTTAEFVSAVKKDPKLGFFGVAPLGGLPHFLGLHFAALNGIELTPVPYNSGAQMRTALISGEAPATYFTPADLIPLHKEGRLRILATSGSTRIASIPEVPTLKEAGYDIDAGTWFTLFAPAGTPAARIEEIATHVTAAMNDPALKKRIVDLGFEPTGLGAKEAGLAMRRDFDRWGPTIKASGYRTD